MGEIADAMLTGAMCAHCGAALCELCASMGIPMYCSEECAKANGVNMNDFGAHARICSHE